MQTLPGMGRRTPWYAGPPPSSKPSHHRQKRRWERWLEPGSLVSLAVVAGSTAFVIAQLHPSLIFGPNMDVGGDTAAHVVAVYYFIHHVLNHGRLSGWDPQWFGGFPLYVFYFPLPAALVGAFTLVTSYAAAFKIVTVLGTVFLPVAAYAFGRLAGFSRPVPALMSAAMIPFLFLYAPSYPHSSVYYSWNIDGGTLASTLAGEFSFSLSLLFAVLFLGVFIYAQRVGRLRWLAALLFAATLLSHIVPGLFAAGAAVAFTLARAGRRTFRDLILIGIVGALVAAFWLVPFARDLHYSSSMNYNRVGDVYGQLFPQNAEQLMQWAAAAGFLIAIWRRNRTAIVIGVLAGATVAAFCWLPAGLVYNGRWLPFWYLTTALLAAYAIGELGRFAFAGLGVEPINEVFTGLVGAAVPIALVAAWLGVLPFGNFSGNRNPVDGWATWNYSGYQGKPGWPEFARVVAMLKRAAAVHGCGNLNYEYSPNTESSFGSTLVPMSFPLWTNGCIGSAEGLYYESSTSNHFHFLDQSELSLEASNPVVGLPYRSLNVADGIHHLQLTGVKYFLANSPTVERAASSDPALVEVASTPESPAVVDGNGSSAANSPAHPLWILYLVRHSSLVVPLQYEPVVETGLTPRQWQWTTAIAWYQFPQYWPVEIVSGGPSAWVHAARGTLVLPSGSHPIQPTSVSRIKYSDSHLSFDATRLGEPVLVKVPYFPNWTAKGARGPYEATPNLMVVVPTTHHVVLQYESKTTNWVGDIGSVVGLLGVLALVRSSPPRPSSTPRSPINNEPEPTPSVDSNGDGAEETRGEDSEDHDPWRWLYG